MAVVILLAVTVWLFVGVTGWLRESIAAAAGFLPNWFPVVNLAVLPLLVAGFIISRSWPLPAQLSLFSLIIVSVSCTGLAADRYPLVTVTVIAVVYLEIFWIMPKWKGKVQSRKSPDTAN
jgi:hypothetical protein